MERELTGMSTDPIDKNISTNSHKEDDDDDDDDLNGGSSSTTVIPTTKDENIADEEPCENGSESKENNIPSSILMKSESDEAEAQINVVDDVKEKIPESNIENVAVKIPDANSEEVNTIAKSNDSSEELMATDVNISDVEVNQKDDVSNGQVQMDTIEPEPMLKVPSVHEDEKVDDTKVINEIENISNDVIKPDDVESKLDAPSSTETADDECLPTSPKVPRIEKEEEKEKQSAVLIEMDVTKPKESPQDTPIATENIKSETETVLLGEENDSIVSEPIVEEPSECADESAQVTTNLGPEITEMLEPQCTIDTASTDKEPIVTEPEVENDAIKQAVSESITEVQDDVQSVAEETGGIEANVKDIPILETVAVDKSVVVEEEVPIIDESISVVPLTGSPKVEVPIVDESIENAPEVKVPVTIVPVKTNLDELNANPIAEITLVQPEIIIQTDDTSITSSDIIPESPTQKILHEKNNENTEKMSVEEIETTAATSATQNVDSAMEATSIIPANIQDDDDEQMDIDEANSIDPMDL